MNVKGFSQRRSAWTLLVAALFSIVSLGLPSKANAQLEELPVWAVTEFQDISGNGDSTIGRRAAEAFVAETAKLGTVDVLPLDTTMRAVRELGYDPQQLSNTGLVRLGQNLLATTVVTGEIYNYRVVEDGNQRYAQVIMRVVVRDVASGLIVNGASVGARSGYRAADVSNEVLYNEALEDGAFRSVQEISRRQLPTGTVLNVTEGRVLVNRGTQSGFKTGMEVVVVRGREQVASATVTDVDFDSAILSPKQIFKGVRPGDKIRVIFDVPVPKADWDANGNVAPAKRRSGGNNSGLVTLLILVVILGFLLGGDRASSTQLVHELKAEPMIQANDVPGVKVSWVRDAFLRGNNEGPFWYQVWRNDSSAAPVAVTSGGSSSVIDDAQGANAPGTGLPWYDFGGVIGGQNCDNATPPTGTGTPVLLNAGIPYNYSVELVYRVSALSLPGSGTTGGGTTGSNTTGTNTTGTNTTGTNTTGTNTTGTNTTGSNTTGTNTTGGTGSTNEYCYFMSSRVAVPGQATPLNRPTLQNPANDQIVTTPIAFQFSSVRGAVASVQLEYAVQFSSEPSFPSDRTITVDPFVDLVTPSGSTVSSPTIDTSLYFPTSQVVYWRVGVKNIEDDPGPVQDSTGKRYIYSSVRRFRRTAVPPAPPLEALN